MAEVKNLYQRLAAITAQMPTVGKNLNVETGKGRGYKAVSERDILDAVKPLEAKHGIYSYPYSRELIESERLESTGYDGKAKTTFYTKLRTTYRFVNIDKPEEYIDIEAYAVGLDSGDKGDGKAMTYSDKYALMKAYKISTGDDPDQDASGDNNYTSQKVSKTNIDALKASCLATNTDIAKLLDAYGCQTPEELTVASWVDAMSILEKRKK